MRKAILLFAVPALVAGVGLLVRGQGPMPPEPAAGKVLLLKSERILEGDVERVAGQYVLRRGTSEVTILAGQALRLCADRTEAFQFMQGRANLLDPDERLRLARWCQSNGLAEQAREELRAALEMRPNHGETKRLAKLLQHQAPAGKAAPATPTPAPAPLPSVNLNFETVTAFATKVQPILMNTCVNCHSGGRGGSFQLSRVYEGGQRASTQRNIAAVLSQVNFEKPAGSPLLIMALSAHGNQNGPPLPGRQAATFQAIVQWLDRALADNPHLGERFAAAPMPRGATEAAEQRTNAPSQPQVVSRPLPRIESQAAPAKLPASLEKSEPVTPLPKAFVPNDEFDAESFNRQARPKD